MHRATVFPTKSLPILAAAIFAAAPQIATGPLPIKPIGQTDVVGTDPDDPAIWVHPTDPSKSLILGTDKIELPGGALYVFDLNGKVVQKITSLDRPNNVDVEYGFKLGGRNVDIAVLTERKKHRLRIFAIDQANGQLRDVSGATSIFKSETGDRKEPMGIGLYRSPKGYFDAIVSPKSGPQEGYLGQFRLKANGDKIDVEELRRFGKFSGEGEIESVFVDDELGFVYCSDEGAGIRKYSVDLTSSRELAMFGTAGYKGDREGLAIYATGPGKGYLLSTDQIEGGSITKVYRREGANELVAEFAGGADDTDGIDVTSAPLGDRFPYGIWVAMNSGPKNFLIYSGDAIRSALSLK